MEPVYERFTEPFLKVLHGLYGSIELYQTKVIFRPARLQGLFARGKPISIRFEDINRVTITDGFLDRINVLTIYPVNHAPISVAYIHHINRHEIALDIKRIIEEALQAHNEQVQANIA